MIIIQDAIHSQEAQLCVQHYQPVCQLLLVETPANKEHKDFLGALTADTGMR